MSTIDERAGALAAELVDVRRRLHAHPEPSGAEVQTTAAIAERLRQEGLAPVVLRSGTGLVCDLGGRIEAGTPYVVLRADIDALSMPDAKDVPYRSRNHGVAHACGHDVHTTVVLGAGLVLHPLLGGARRVRLVFEPREETVPGGAVEVIEDGWIEGASAVFGLHCDPKLDVGRLAVRVGPITSASDLVELRLHGPGGHTARPHLTVDLVAVAGRLAADLPSVVSRLAQPDGQAALVFGSLNAGTAPNVIPAEAVLRGTLRTPSPAAWARAPQLLEAAVDEVLAGTGATRHIGYFRGVPPVVNDEAATGLLAQAGREVLGEDAVVAAEHSMGGDSFAWYLEEVPGSYARLGVHDPASDGPRLDLHASTFDVDERCIGYGVRVLARAALAALDGLDPARS
ncbi:MAG TPA: amidohydrolase [Actinomycetes bacterium]|nr:amidohydrolase [Actinomycetes bacterium]